ncbi:FMN adenylyltransferase / Riboflavin kinase [hydrothermal vent metagenome]|uniref:Bifunctional riboflavin kinase/FMN adenylyltransferase n=1 Tax=hydrothermal vent metagenome TaxID=652676 RepID=A0A3B1BVS6_9ZZZZ
MKIIRGLRNLAEKPKNAVVTIGNFDGAHVGHQEIFRRVVAKASEIDGTPIVYTFDPHPLKILAPEQNLNLLTTFKQKMEFIQASGIEMVICADFTRDFARMHPRDFAVKIYKALSMDSVFVGTDYTFGRQKAGGIDYLKKMGDELGFRLYVVEPVMVDGERVSSTAIREYLYGGEVGKASKLLGRFYAIAGKVVSGYKRGKAIGFPTANLETPYDVIPAVGVYAIIARLDQGEWYEGVVNIGYNPTFNRDDFIVEAHLLNLDKDIYNKEIEVFFVDRLRDEKSFESVEELKSGIAHDIERAKEVLIQTRNNPFVIDPRSYVK